jgi:hypothetical protein
MNQGNATMMSRGAVAARGPGWPVDLDDPLAALKQVSGEAGAEAAAAFDGPTRALSRWAQSVPDGMAGSSLRSVRGTTASSSNATRTRSCTGRSAVIA